MRAVVSSGRLLRGAWARARCTEPPCFDTLAAQRDLQAAGFESGQSEALVRMVGAAAGRAGRLGAARDAQARSSLLAELEGHKAVLSQQEAQFALRLRESMGALEKELVAKIAGVEASRQAGISQMNEQLAARRGEIQALEVKTARLIALEVSKMEDKQIGWATEAYREHSKNLNELYEKHHKFQLRMYGVAITALVGVIGLSYSLAYEIVKTPGIDLQKILKPEEAGAEAS